MVLLLLQSLVSLWRPLVSYVTVLYFIGNQCKWKNLTVNERNQCVPDKPGCCCQTTARGVRVTRQKHWCCICEISWPVSHEWNCKIRSICQSWWYNHNNTTMWKWYEIEPINFGRAEFYITALTGWYCWLIAIHRFSPVAAVTHNHQLEHKVPTASPASSSLFLCKKYQLKRSPGKLFTKCSICSEEYTPSTLGIWYIYISTFCSAKMQPTMPHSLCTMDIIPSMLIVSENISVQQWQNYCMRYIHSRLHI